MWENVRETRRLFIDLEQIKFLFVFFTETLKSCPALLGLLYTSDGQIVWQQLDHITEFVTSLRRYLCHYLFNTLVWVVLVQNTLNTTTQNCGSTSFLLEFHSGGKCLTSIQPHPTPLGWETSACLVPFHQCQRSMITGFSSVSDWIQVERLISRPLIASVMNRHHGAFRIETPSFTFMGVKLRQTEITWLRVYLPPLISRKESQQNTPSVAGVD